MKHSVKELPQSQVELSISVTPDEYKKHLEKAAIRISERTNIKGFRKGKAPYDHVVREVGEMNIMNEALETIVQESFYKAVTEEKLETIGMPKIEVDKVAPGNDIEYKATVALVPDVKLPDLTKIKVKHDTKDVTDEDVKNVVKDLTKMQAKEVLVEEAATEDHMIEIDMDLKKDNVPVEGGQAKGYKVHLAEKEHHIPGFNDQLIGLKAGEEKTFELPFPEKYHNAMLAGNNATFEIKVKGVYNREFPEVNDDFAKTLGQDSLEKLEAKIRENMEMEAKQKADHKAEIEIFDTIIEKTKFDEIPEVLIDAERKKMFYELQKDLDRNGITIAQYLSDIKKTEEDLFNDFKEQATKRAKATLISRKVAEQEKIEITKEELEKEVEMMKQMYKGDETAQENLKNPEVIDTIRTIQQNKKVVEFLKENVLDSGEKKTKKAEEKGKK